MLKKIIINIAVVFAIVFALDFVIGRAIRFFYFKETSGLHFRTTYSIEKTTADILVFGSSRANHHYVPEVFEDSLKISFYNTGRDGNNIIYQTAILKSILNRYTPKMIICDYAWGFEKGEIDRISSLLPYYRLHKEIRKFVELKSPFEKVKLLSEIYPFNSQILTIAIGNMEINKKRSRDDKGYIALFEEWQDEIDSIPNDKIYELDSNKISYFREFISVAKESGAMVYIVYSPIFQKYDKNQEIDICKNICKSENVPTLDFSRDTLFLQNKQLFYDIEHLNHKGALIFSNLVVEKIKPNIKNLSL